MDLGLHGKLALLTGAQGLFHEIDDSGWTSIAFLCSERASFVNGSNYRVDAGSVATI